MNEYSSHTYKWINDAVEIFYDQYTFKTDQGIRNLTSKQAADLKSTNPDYATQDLYKAIERGNCESWRFYVQIMPEAEAAGYKYDILDITKVRPHGDYPLIEVGKLVLNRNPDNFFAETKQSAFAPTHTVPGIGPSDDKML